MPTPEEHRFELVRFGMMSTQALESVAVRAGLLDILLNYPGLWEALREKAATAGA